MGNKLELTREVSLEELKHWHRQETDPRVRDRILMLIHTKQGYATRNVAQMVNVSKGTVASWVHRFNEGGRENLHDQPHPGRPPKVDYENLAQALDQSPQAFGYPQEAWYPALVRRYLNEHQHLTVHKEHIYWIINRAGFVLRVPRSRSYRSDPVKVDTFKKNEKDHP